MYNRNKININKKRFVKNTTLCKYNYLFNMIVLTKDNIQILQS